MMPRRIGSIFVTPDNPAFLERDVEPQRETFDIERANAASMLDAYRAKQRMFTTAPFDPTGERLRFYPGGFTVWSGFPGAGKTTLLRQLVCQLLRATDDDPMAGPGVFVCSLEEEPQDVLIRHAEVACATREISENGLQWCADLWAQKLKLWNYRPMEDDARHLKILAAIRVLARDHGVRHAIIDSLMCLDVSSADYEAQRLFAGAVARTALASGVHIHLVAHPRKPQNGQQDLDTSDVAGSADIGRKADNVLFVKRASQEAGATVGPCTPMVVSIKKQRHGSGFIGDVHGWFHRGFRQFVSTEWQDSPMQYLPSVALQEVGRRA